MKKFLFVLFLLIAIGGAGFFLGWTHLTVPPGSYGVMRSKTHGLEAEVIQDGEFRWLWYKAIPKNTEITVYTISPVRRSFRSSGSLGSGGIYASLAGLDTDFSWDITGELAFSLKPEILPELTMREGIIDDTGLRNAESRIAGRIENFVLQRLRGYAEAEDERMMDSLIFSGSVPELNNEIQDAFPEVESLSCVIRVVSYPDYTLYQSVKALYQEYMAQQTAALAPDIAREAEKRIDTRIRLDELARYGELLSRYPVLLEYLALEKGFPPSVTND